jgi:hypothetical protein
MFSWLKKHFIPHEGNNHRPHILRDLNTRNIVAIVIFLEIFTFLIPTLTHLNTTGNMAAVLPAVLADLTNEERESKNLSILAVNPLLNKAAEMKAKDMATLSYFAHTSPLGKTPWYWLEQAGYQYQYAGENLAINFSDSKDVTDAWMESPTHRANIVKGNYTEIGTGVATGMYEGHETIFVAQVYANPLPKTIEQKTETRLDSTRQVKTIPAAAAAPKVTTTNKEPTNVLGAEVTTTSIQIQQPTFWQMLIASPRNTTNIILYIFFGIIFIALLLYIIIKMRNHHIDLITNGLIVLAIIGAVFLANYYFSHKNMAITQSLDYSNENK